MTQTETQTGVRSKRFYTRVLPLFVCSLFAGVYIAQTILRTEPLQIVYTAFAETQGMVNIMVQLFSTVVLFLAAIRSIASYRTQETTLVTRNITIILSSIGLSLFFLSQPEMEQSVIVSSVNSLLQGACTYGLFVARYGMMYYWVLRRFCEFRTVDRMIQLAMWLLWTWRDTPVLMNATPWIEDVVDWIRFTLYTGALRGILFTVAIGSVIISIRALLGREPGLIEAEVV